MNDRIELRIRVSDSDDLAAANSVSERIDAIEYQQAPAAPEAGEYGEQIAPIAAVLIGAGVIAGAKFIKDWWAERGGGLVIDQRPDAVDDIYRNPTVPYGYVLVYPRDGGDVNVKVMDAPKDAAERWISEVISGAYKSVGELAKLVADKPAGDKIEVVTEPT